MQDAGFAVYKYQMVRDAMNAAEWRRVLCKYNENGLLFAFFFL